MLPLLILASTAGYHSMPVQRKPSLTSPQIPFGKSKTPIECQPDSQPGFGPFCFHVYITEAARSMVDRVEFWSEPSTMFNTTFVHEPYSVNSTDIWLSVKWNGDNVTHQNWNVTLFYKIHGQSPKMTKRTTNILEVPMSLTTGQYIVGSDLFNVTGGNQTGLLPLQVMWHDPESVYNGVMNLALGPNKTGTRGC